MSLQPQPFPPLPLETAQIAQKIFRRRGNIYLTIGDQIGPLFADVDFADLYAADGAPAISPNLLALAVIFQRQEDLADQAMADAVRARIDLKYALHLAVDDPGFDGSLLSDFAAVCSKMRRRGACLSGCWGAWLNWAWWRAVVSSAAMAVTCWRRRAC